MIELIKQDNSIIRLNDDVNYWWVNQGKTFDYEVSMGHIQSSTRNIKHHKALLDTEIDDIVIHYAKSEIRAISRITKTHYIHHLAGIPHRRNRCEYFLLRVPINIGTAMIILISKLHVLPQPPFQTGDKIRQQYLMPITKKIFDLLFPTPIRVF